MSAHFDPSGRRVVASIGGVPITMENEAAAVSQIIAAASAQDGFSVFTLNLDHLDKLRYDERFRAAYASARFITADGAPVALLASRQGGRVERTAGADLVVPLALAAARHDLPIYFYGSSEAVLKCTEAHLSELSGNTLRVVGAEAPPLGFDPHSAEADAAIDRIAASGARLCFVALGAPKQELLAARAVARGVKVGFVCIGAGLDFIAGAQVRAPLFMQRHGLEWVWRLGSNPRRLATRYGRCAVVLLRLLWALPTQVRTAR